MTVNDNNKALAHRVYDAFNRRDLDGLDMLLAVDMVDHTAGPAQAPGREGIKVVWSYLFATYPDITATVEDLLADGDRVAARVIFSSLSAVEPRTGMGLEFTRIFEGRVVELWNSIRWE
ncbi:MAG: ester cyclase [Chloroflexota bacterium]|nr:ester cyclase [Chloroflexota bacterium]